MPPYRTPVIRKPKVRVKAKPKPKPFTIKGAGDSKAKSAQARVPAKRKTAEAAKAIVTTAARGAGTSTAGKFKLTKREQHRAEIREKLKHPAKKSGIDAPLQAASLKILEQTTRPTHALAGATRAAIRGENVPKAAGRGAANKDRYTFSDVLDAAGVHNKIAKGVGGTVLDIVTDPTTYVTLGAGVPAEIAAKQAAKAATKRALKQGLTEDQAKNFAAMAARQSRKDTTRGIRLGARGGIPFTDKRFDVKTSGATTAKAGRKAKKTRPGKAAARGNAQVRTGLHETVAPDVTPAFRSREEHETIRAAERRTRASISTGEKRVTRRARAFAAAEPKKLDEALKNVAAIERKEIDMLPLAQQPVARSYESDLAEQEAAKAQRGIGKTFAPRGPKDAQAYFPHEITPTTAKVAAARGKRKPAEDKERKLRLPLVEAIKVKPGRYVEVPHAAYAQASRSTVRNVALADLWKDVAGTGRRFNRASRLTADEAVYKVTPTGLEKLKPQAEKQALKDPRGRYVVLDSRSVDTVLENIPQRGQNRVTRFYDTVQGKTKKLQTVYNPAYQPRNLTGDTILGWQADTNLKSFRQAASGTRALRLRNKAEASPEAVTAPGKATAKADRVLDRELDLKKSGKSTMRAELQAAEEHGAIGAGQVQTDIKNQIGEQQEGALWQVNAAREDFPRFATFLSARKRGMGQDEAAKYSLERHIDYADLTKAEKVVARRAFQFYTFFARNTRIQAKSLLTRPGKAATVQKVLEEASKASGYGSYSEWVSQLPDYNQRGMPIPVKVGDSVFPVFISPPQTDLAQLSLNPAEQVQSVLNRATFFKTIPELALNYSIFFQGPIQPPDHERTVAPRGLNKLLDNPVTAGFAKDVLGLKPIKDKRSGRKVWGWYRTADYVSRSFPQSNFGVSSLKPAPDDRGLNGPVAVLSFLTGVKVAPDKRGDYRVNAAYDKLDTVKNKLSNLRDEGISAEHPTPEYTGLLKTQRRLQVKVRRLRVKRGDAVIPKTGKPRKRDQPHPDDPLFGSGQEDTAVDPLFGASAKKKTAPVDPLFGD